MATYVNDLRLKEIATGDEAGTWGASTNTNLELIAEAFSFGTEAITTNADTHTTTIADGSTDPGRSLFLKYTGTLDSACTITIGPNTVSKLWLIENATSGSQNIIIKQGSGATVTIANGQTKAIYSDGAGSGAAMVDALQDLSIPDLFIDDDLTFTSDSAVIAFGADGDTTLTHTDGSGLTLNSTNKIMFNDASQFIQGSSATVLSLGATDEIDLTATAIDVNGTIDVSGNATLGGTLGVTGAVTANAGISIDNITIDGTEIDLSSGDLTIDVAGDIIFDADGGDFNFKDGGTTLLSLSNAGSNNVQLSTSISDGDLLIKGNDGGSIITALSFDMSAAGAASFNNSVTYSGDLVSSTAGTSNFRAGVNAGNSIASGGNYNVVVGDEAGTAITTGDNNTAVGYQAGDAITTGELNTVIGAGAGSGLTEANRNVAVGKDAMRANTLGSRNVAIGESALDAMNLTSATDSYNIGVGYFAGGSITVGESNTLIGGLAGDALTDADFNVAVGKNALSSDTLGSFSVAVGINALEAQNFTSGTQTYNTAVGGLAGGALTTGIDNTFLGGKAGKSSTTGQYNVYVGTDAGEALTVGSSNVAVGRGALEQDTKGSKTVAIGQGTLNAQNHTSATDSHNAAVGYNAAVAVTTGVQNSVLGSLAGDSITTGNGNTILGYNADVNSGSAASRIVIGNQVVGEGDNRITVGVGGNIATLELDGSDTSWAASSDERLKENITDSTAGLSFINDLRPVTYNWKKAKDVPSDLPQYVEGSEEPCLGITYGTELHGFIAQEVKTALDNHPEVKAGQGVWNENPSTVQTLAPSALIPMLVKAIQELTARVTELEGE